MGFIYGKEVPMHGNLVTQAAMTTLRCVIVVVSHRSLMKLYIAFCLDNYNAADGSAGGRFLEYQ